MPMYRLRAGQRHSARVKDAKQARKGIRQMEPGEEIELAPHQALAWKDKFELVGPTSLETDAEVALKNKAHESALEVVEATGKKDMFNVRNKSTGEYVNDEPMSFAEALKLVEI